ncbi:MAG: hypothetical protein V1725_00835 [archaeon]
MKPVIFLVAVLVLPSIFSFDCQRVSDNFSCEVVQNSTNLTLEEKDLLYASLLYPDTALPDHSVVREQNLAINVTEPPDTVTLHNGTLSVDAWLSLLAFMPSVLDNETLLVPADFEVLSAYDYALVLSQSYLAPDYPDTDGGDCRRDITLSSNQSVLNVYVSNALQGQGRLVSCHADDNATISAELAITIIADVQHYQWNTWCCWWHHGTCWEECHSCNYHSTETITDTLTLTDAKNVTLITEQPIVSLTLLNQYRGTTKGNISASDYSLLRIDFPDAFIERQSSEYSVLLSSKPYDFLTLKKTPSSRETLRNAVLLNETFWVPGNATCTVLAVADFTTITQPCIFANASEEAIAFENVEGTIRIGLLYKVALVILVLYLLIVLFRRSFAKYLPMLLLFVLLIPGVHADCSITNIGGCLPDIVHNFITNIINAPIQPLLSLVQGLLQEPAPFQVFQGIWTIIVYVLSMFYAFLFIYTGLQFMLSGMSPLKRYLAKEWLKNTVLLIVLVQMSFYLYGLFIELGSVMTSAVLQLVNPNFFLLTVDSLPNIGLEFLLGSFYMLILIITVMLLTIRFLAVSFGVIFLPVGIFCYFIPPLKSYGRFVLHVLGMMIFITFIEAIILLACSWLVQIPFFTNFKILVMIACFIIIDYLLIKMIVMAIGKSTMESGQENLTQAIKYLAMSGA